MKSFLLRPRRQPDDAVDGSLLRRSTLRDHGEGQTLCLPTATGPVSLDDLFEVHAIDSSKPGPDIWIDGDVPWLDRLGAARPTQPHSGNVGFIFVRGSVGAMTGHRMRRGIVWVDGNAGDWTGAMMIAGSILVAGSCGRGSLADAKRGSLLTGTEPDLEPERFTGIIDQPYHTAKLLRDSVRRDLAAVPSESWSDTSGGDLRWLDRLARSAKVRRGDVTVGGMAEAVWPAATR